VPEKHGVNFVLEGEFAKVQRRPDEACPDGSESGGLKLPLTIVKVVAKYPRLEAIAKAAGWVYRNIVSRNPPRRLGQTGGLGFATRGWTRQTNF